MKFRTSFWVILFLIAPATIGLDDAAAQEGAEAGPVELVVSNIPADDESGLPAPVAAPEADAVASGQPCCCGPCACCAQAPQKVCCCGHCVDWSKVPGSLRPMPRPGNFPAPPTGCGYYNVCDQLHGVMRPKRQPSGYPPFALMPPSFFDANFFYVDDIPCCERNCVERTKRIPLGDCWRFSTGGSFWARYMNEQNSRLSTVRNDYTLLRTRAYGDLVHGSGLRLFGEFIWADAVNEDLPTLPIDVNRGDLLNLFVEAPLFDYCGKDVYARVGRQELLFGSQRLVTTLDWANTRRTFDGVRVFRKGETFDWDLFYTNFVPVEPTDFDTADNGRDFAGAWLTHRPKPGTFFDLYYLYFDNESASTQQNIVRSPTEAHTIGSRYAGDKNGLRWDVEGALQFGTQGNQDLFAGMATAGVGKKIGCSPMSPVFWLYYDYASGGTSDGGTTSNTFNQLYPFGHYYLGWLDLVGRQNIHDVNAHLLFYPRHYMTVWMQYHHFWLADATDALYNAGGVAIRRDATGASGRDVGDELDLVVNFHLSRYSDMLLGYSYLFGGDFVENTGPANDAGFFHAMYQVKW